MFIALGLAALVVLALVLAFSLGRSSSTPPPGSQSAVLPRSAAVPQPESRPQGAPAASGSGSVPYVGPIDSPIIGKWEKHPDRIDAYVVYLEFTTDGTLYMTQFYVEDTDYPENWWVNTYNFYFDTWRGQEILESGYFMGYMHHRVEFYELDGRQAMNIITIKDDNSEYVRSIFLKIEE